MSADFQISLPNWPMARLLKEACASWNLRHPSEPPADPQTSDWRLLHNATLSFLRHDHTDYKQALAQGADRDSLRSQIALAATRHFPWLRIERDPRHEQVEHDSDSRPFNSFSRQLSDLISERSRLCVVIREARRKRESGWREQVAAMEARLAQVNKLAEQLTGFFNTSIRKHGDKAFLQCIARSHLIIGYAFGGRGELPESYIKSAGFKCPACQKTVLRTKTGIDHGSGKRLVAFSCHCLSLSVESKAAYLINLYHWQKSTARNDQSTNIVVLDDHGVLYGHQLARDIAEGRKQPTEAKVFKGASFDAFVALLTVKFPEHPAVRALHEAKTPTLAMLERVSTEIVLTAADIQIMLDSQERIAAGNLGF